MPAVAGVFVADEVQQLTARLSLGHYPVVDVGAVKARHEMTRLLQAQPVRDLGAGGLGGGGGQRDAGHLGPALVQPGQGEVVGPEVVPPLGYAVRLVDGEQGHRAPVEQRHGGLGTQPLRGQVEQVQVAGQECGLHLAPLGRLLGRVQEAGPDAERPHGVHLVLHQRDEGGDDHPGAAADQRGNLVAEGLAAAGRHQHERVAARDDLLDDLLLGAAEGVVAEHPAQYVQGAVRPAAHRGGRSGRQHAAIL